MIPKTRILQLVSEVIELIIGLTSLFLAIDDRALGYHDIVQYPL